MDKYEYKLRAEEIKNLIGEGRYAEAVQIADTVNWKKVKSVKMLCTISDLYKINRRYEESMEILMIAYEHYPEGRYIIYSLCELSIKLQKIVQAIEYFKEFVRIAPHNTSRYILQYKLYVAQDVSIEERIAVLQEFKKHDYREKWGYELAFLYHRVGLTTECVEECDELFLWFGGGRYVMKALELKALHEKLSPEQQRVYERYRVGMQDPQASAAKESDNYDNDRDEMGHNESVSAVTPPEEAEDGEFHVKTVDVGQYNTINLQQVIAESLRELQKNAEKPPRREEKPQAKMPADDMVSQDTKVVGGREEEPQDDDTANTGILGITEEDLEAYEEDNAETEEKKSPDEPDSFALNMKHTANSIATDETIWMPSIPDMAKYQAEDEPVYEEPVQINARTIAQATGEIPMAVPVETPRGIPETEMDAVTPDGRAVEEALQPESRQTGEKRLVEELQNEIISSEEEARRIRAAERRAELKSRESSGMRQVSMDTRRMGQTREYVPVLQPVIKETPREEFLQNAKTGGNRVVRPGGENGFDSLLSQGSDGQISLAMDEARAIERQITGQISIEEFLTGWEDHKKELANGQKDSVSENVRQRTDEIFKEYDENEKRDLQHRLEEAQNEAIRREAEDKEQTENAVAEEALTVEPGAGSLPEAAETSEEKPAEETAGEAVSGEPAADEAEGSASAEPSGDAGETAAATPAGEAAENKHEKTGRHSREEIAHQLAVLEGRISPDAPVKSVTEKADDAEIQKAESEAVQPAPDAGAVREAMQPAPIPAADDQTDDEAAFRVMTQEEKELFGPYIHKKRSRQQIVNAIDSISMAAYAGNCIITGEEGAGTINLAKGLIRSVQLSDSNFSGQIAKISGRAMNRKRVDAIIDKLSGGALIVQGAGSMNNETTGAMMSALQSENKGIIVILEDTRKNMEKYLKKHPELESVFNVRVDAQALATRELVSYAKQYALDREYSMDEFAVLALHKRIDEMQTAEHEVTIAEVREIVDEAIKRASKGSPSHFFDVLLQKRYDDDDMIILREKDFLR
ncbi:MAG: hypothetical protein K6C95_08370 [Lachnospiraceae bacterium]|nr:hypothetical protein [Lachnospiraceae bacterium]